VLTNSTADPTFPATAPIVVPAAPRKRDVDDFRFRMDLLRRRQLHRPDVREKLSTLAIRRAEGGLR
jgi:hypothetical protein